MAGTRYLAPILALGIAACGVATPARVAILRPAAAPVSIAFDPAGPEGAPNPALAATFRQSLGATLVERGVPVETESRYRLAIGFAIRPADGGVGQINGAAMDWTSEPRRHRWFHACRAQRVDAVVAMRDTATGEVIGRWRGGLDHCEPGDPQARELASRFAEAIASR